jgi:hypothetical protein
MSLLASLLVVGLLTALPVTGAGARQSGLAALGGANTAPIPSDETLQRGSPDDSLDVELQFDAGVYGNAVGVVTTPNQDRGFQAVYLNRFTPDPETFPFNLDVIKIVVPATSNGGPTNMRSGMNFEALVYLDPTGSGDPANAQLVRRVPYLTTVPDDNRFQEIGLVPPVRVESGDVWVGFTNTITRGDNQPIYPGPIDFTVRHLSRSWIFYNSINSPDEHFNGENLASADVGITLDDEGRFPGAWMIRAAASQALVDLTWEPPAEAGGPARFLQALDPTEDERGAPEANGAGALARGPGLGIIAYKVYRSSTSPVSTIPDNLFATVDPAQTLLRSSASKNGSFFVVTVCYEDGSESDPSNEASGGLEAADVTQIKFNFGVGKIAGRVGPGGTLFTDTVEVTVDGIGFTMPARVKKNNTKAVQKGTLANGQRIGEYMTPGREVIIGFRNSDGAIANRRFTRQP